MLSAARPESLGTQLPAMALADQRDLLPRVAVPTLLVWGEADTRSPLSVAHQFEAMIPAAELVLIPDAGHVSNLERPGPFNDALRRFCREHPPRSG
jgi:pimeloyl-ACP methyl ester carboxylesterase